MTEKATHHDSLNPENKIAPNRLERRCADALWVEARRANERAKATNDPEFYLQKARLLSELARRGYLYVYDAWVTPVGTLLSVNFKNGWLHIAFSHLDPDIQEMLRPLVLSLLREKFRITKNPTFQQVIQDLGMVGNV
ncbi:hypothetical protein MYX78_01075 [Acidobacteria bacterium AH-259-G07]|nr:hypothetical protein [Acidobacteria bacterium AH-259-G07]